MNTADVKTIKMFGPALSGPARLVNRDVPACDEQAYKAAGYKRGSISEVSEAAESAPVKAPVLGSEEIFLEEPGPAVEPVEQAPAKPRRKKNQN
jgi:hypothetical protein